MAALAAAMVCSGCGNGADKNGAADVNAAQTAEAGAEDGAEDVEEGNADTGAADEQSDGEDAQEEDGPKVLDHFTGGILYEDGDYLFSIESMGMTEEGYEIFYHAHTDSEGHRGAYEMNVVVNGVRTSFEGMRFYNDTEDGQNGSDYMLCSTENPARLVISREYLEKLGAEEVKSLSIHLELGSEAYGSIETRVEEDYLIYPGDVVDTAVTFPEPERDSWVLADNEYGKVQIIRAAYNKYYQDNARVHVYVLTQGVGGEDFPRYGVGVQVERLEEDGRTIAFDSDDNDKFYMYSEPYLYEDAFIDWDIPFEDCEEGFLSPVTITVSADGNETAAETVLDFTHLEYEEEGN